MTRRLAAIVWSPAGLRVARAAWRAGRLEAVTTADVPGTDLDALEPPLDPGTALAVVLPSTEAGRRIVTLPFRGGRAVDEVVLLEARGALPIDPGPLRVGWEALPAPDRHSTRVAAVFVREATLATIDERLARRGASALRIDAAPMPVWALIGDTKDTGLVVLDPAGAWVAATAADGRPLFARPLHADPSDEAALAAEVCRTFETWGVVPARLVLAGRCPETVRAALADACGTPWETLAPPEALGGALEDEPLLAGALLAVARRADLPLALVAPGAVSRHQRRRLRRLAAAAVVLAALYGALGRVVLARRAEALQAGVAAVVADALPDARADGSYERLEAAVASLPTGPPIDPALVRLHEVLSHLPSSVALDLRHLHVDPEHVQVGGNVATFDAVETLRGALAQSPRIADVTIAEMRSRLDAAGVEFRIEGRWLSPGERAS
jgi:hypothetical protein